MKYIPVDLGTPNSCTNCILYRPYQYYSEGQCVAMPDLVIVDKCYERHQDCPFDKAKEFDE